MPTASELITKIRAEGVDQYARDMGKAESVTDKTAKNMDQAGKSAGGLSSGFTGAAKQAGVLAAGLGAFDIGKTAISGLFGAMESGTKTVGSLQAQLGLTKDEAEALGKVGTEVFRNNFAGSMSEAAAAAGQVQQMLGAMDSSSLQTATENAFRLNDAFGIEVPESLSAVKTLMDNFGLSSEQAFDLVTTGMQKGLNRSGDFLDTINEYGTQFKNNGFSAEQFFNVLDSGLQGGALGTDKAADAVKEFGIRFTEMADPVKKALGDIGLNADELASQIASGQITQADAFQQVVTALGNVDDKTKQYAAGQALLGTQFEDLGVDAALALSTVGTSLDETAGKTKALDAQYSGFGATFETLKRQALTGFLQPLAEQMGGVLNAALPLIGAFGSLALAIPALLPVIGPVVAILAGPLTLAIGGIVLAIAGLVLAWQNDWGGIQGKTEAVVNFIRPILDALAARLQEFGALILPELVAAWESMSGAVQGVVNTLQPIIEGVFGAIQGFLQNHSTEINTIVQGAWDAIVVIIETVTGVISNTIQFWLNILQGDWSGAWTNVKNTVQIIWDGIKSLIEIALSVLPSVISLGMALVQTAVDAAWGAIKSAVNEAINGEGGVIAIMRAMPGAILSALSGLGTLLTGLGADLIQGFINGVQSMWNSAISFVGNLFDGVIGAVKGILGISSPSTVMHEAGVNFIQGFIDGTGSMAGALKDFVTGLASQAFEKFKSTIGGALGAAGDFAGDVLGGITGGGGGGGTPEQVTNWLRQAMQITGVPDDWLPYLQELVMRESGGNPNAVNPQAVIQNGVNYGHATGLLQTIPGTFAANNVTGGSITDPVANAAAAITYIKKTYGHPSAALAGHSARGGYAAGGGVADGLFTVGERGFELGYKRGNQVHIFSNEQSKALLSGMSGGARVPGFQSGTLVGGGEMPGLMWTPESIARYLEILQQLNAAYAAGTLTLETYNRHVEGLAVVLQPISATIPPLVANGLQPLLTTTQGLSATIPPLVTGGIQPLLAGAEGLSQTIPPLVSNGMQPLLGTTKELSATIPPLVGNGFQPLLKGVDDLSTSIPPLIGNGIQPLLSTTETLGANAKDATPAVGGAADSLTTLGSAATAATGQLTAAAASLTAPGAFGFPPGTQANQLTRAQRALGPGKIADTGAPPQGFTVPGGLANEISYALIYGPATPQLQAALDKYFAGITGANPEYASFLANTFGTPMGGENGRVMGGTSGAQMGNEARLGALIRQAGNRGMGARAQQIAGMYYDGRITLSEAIRRLEDLLSSGGVQGRAGRIGELREGWQGGAGGMAIDYDRLGAAVASAIKREGITATIDGEQVYRHTSDRLMRDSNNIVGRRK